MARDQIDWKKWARDAARRRDAALVRAREVKRRLALFKKDGLAVALLRNRLHKLVARARLAHREWRMVRTLISHGPPPGGGGRPTT